MIMSFEESSLQKLYNKLKQRDFKEEELLELPTWFSEGALVYEKVPLWILDLDKGSSEVLKGKLTSMGFSNLRTFNSFNDFWVSLTQGIKDGELPDIIIMSSNLGIVDPLELAKALKATPETKDINIIITTSRAASSYRAEAFEAGVDDVLLKPVNSKELSARIKLLLRNKYVGILERRLIVEKLRQEREKKLREAYREVIAAVTSGKLIIMDRDDFKELLDYWKPTRRWELITPKDITRLRNELHELLQELNMPEERIEDFCLAVGEIATNAIKHASQGEAYFLLPKSSQEGELKEVALLVEDKGEGIDFSKLARSTLLPGFSTKSWSLGMGFTLALSLTDGIVLTTDENGTSVILKKRLKEKTEEERIEEFLSSFQEVPPHFLNSTMN